MILSHTSGRAEIQSPLAVSIFQAQGPSPRADEALLKRMLAPSSCVARPAVRVRAIGSRAGPAAWRGGWVAERELDQAPGLLARAYQRHPAAPALLARVSGRLWAEPVHPGPLTPGLDSS